MHSILRLYRRGNRDSAVLYKMRLDHIHRSELVQVRAAEYLQNLLRLQLLVGVVGNGFDRISEILPHLRRQYKPKLLLQQESDSAFSALAVDADDVGVVGASDVRGINRDVRNIPLVESALLSQIMPLAMAS